MRTPWVLVLAALLAAPAAAQPPERANEFFLGVGDAGLLFAFEDVLVTVGTLGYVSYEDEQLGFQVVGGWQRWLSRWASLGVTGGWAGSKKTAVIGGTPRGDVERRMLTLMLDGRAHWLRRPRVELYSGLGLGYVHLSDDLTDVPDEDAVAGFGFHVIPLGLRAGRDLGVFLETGAGWHGFVKAGVDLRR